jgi:probable F420-dependent oxidoreductase
MQLGVFLPISGRAAGPATLMEAARKAEASGYHSVWAADRVIIPWDIHTSYPYSDDNQFIVPPDRPFLDPLTCLAFLAGCTEKIVLGMSVLVLPYRHPLHWAKIMSTLDHLSRGRTVLGVGVGWLKEEFDALGVPFEDRGSRSDEQLLILRQLWDRRHPRFQGRYYRFDNVAFYPKPLQKPRIPLWVGGEGIQAQRRAGRYGDAWFPYFVTITPKALAARFDRVRYWAAETGRGESDVHLCCCLPVQLTREPVYQEEGRLKGDPAQLVEALRAYEGVGVEHLALQFMAPRWPDRLEQIERFGQNVLPHLGGKAKGA